MSAAHLERLIHDLEFENTQLIKQIQGEEQEIDALKIQRKENTEETTRLEKENSELDEMIKHFHSLFTRNRQGIESSKRTLTILREHEDALRRELQMYKLQAVQEKKKRELTLAKYQAIWEDYSEVYESFEQAIELRKLQATNKETHKKLQTLKKMYTEKCLSSNYQFSWIHEKNAIIELASAWLEHKRREDEAKKLQEDSRMSPEQADVSDEQMEFHDAPEFPSAEDKQEQQTAEDLSTKSSNMGESGGANEVSTTAEIRSSDNSSQLAERVQDIRNGETCDMVISEQQGPLQIEQNAAPNVGNRGTSNMDEEMVRKGIQNVQVTEHVTKAPTAMMNPPAVIRAPQRPMQHPQMGPPQHAQSRPGLHQAPMISKPQPTSLAAAATASTTASMTMQHPALNLPMLRTPTLRPPQVQGYAASMGRPQQPQARPQQPQARPQQPQARPQARPQVVPQSVPQPMQQSLSQPISQKIPQPMPQPTSQPIPMSVPQSPSLFMPRMGNTQRPAQPRVSTPLMPPPPVPAMQKRSPPKLLVPQSPNLRPMETAPSSTISSPVPTIPAPPSPMQIPRSPKKTRATSIIPGTPSRPVRSEVDSTVPISEASNNSNIQAKSNSDVFQTPMKPSRKSPNEGPFKTPPHMVPSSAKDSPFNLNKHRSFLQSLHESPGSDFRLPQKTMYQSAPAPPPQKPQEKTESFMTPADSSTTQGSPQVMSFLGSPWPASFGSGDATTSDAGSFNLQGLFGAPGDESAKDTPDESPSAFSFGGAQKEAPPGRNIMAMFGEGDNQESAEEFNFSFGSPAPENSPMSSAFKLF